jgi:error-prone DNA polymerase
MASTTDYVELRCRSAFSFLAGASLPEDLVERAAALGHDTLALADRNGLYAAPRFFLAARKAGVRPLVGAEVMVEGAGLVWLLVESRAGYRHLCRLLTDAALGREKGAAAARWEQLEEHAGGLFCLAGGAEGPLARPGAAAHLDRLCGIFGRRLAVDVHRHGERAGERLARALADLAATRAVAVVATNDVRHATPGGRALLDVLTCIRLGTTLDAAGRRLLSNTERHLKTPAEMAAAFRDLPAAIRESRRIAERCEFTLADLGYRFPDFPLPPGDTPMGHLRMLTERGARERWGLPSDRVRRQLAHELGMIERLDLAGYFLIVWDIVRFCRERGILCQGRGSAANSAVCYALGITAVDAVGMELLFERFLSEERGEWPDIDIDLPSGDRREDVIQYVYRRYGERGAGMTATVISYRTRSAVREAGKALGLSLEQVDRLAKLLRQHGWHDQHDELAAQLRAGGVDPQAPRIELLVAAVRQMQGLPRHLGQHTGGMVIAAGRLDEVVPLEPAAMPGRNVIQWDKEDCTDLGLIKVDLLGLGMLAALEEAIPLVREHEGVEVDLAHLPPDDPTVYAMLRRADTIGVFQVESRAQMATLPRMRPDHFYDLVVEVAIIRPGPIVGQMVHPYLARRNRRAPVTYAHPLLEPILKRTLGVPLFQEQLLRMAMAVAGFTGGEAEELRRALGFRRSTARMEAIEERLRSGMAARGITGAVQEEIVTQITAFALYGFPECVVGDTRVIDADTGQLVRIEEVVAGRATLRTTLACDEEMKLRQRRVLGAVSSGPKMVYRLRTVLGREITATAEHPFLTVDGWRKLGELRTGDHVAVARELPSLGARRWHRHELIVLAGLIAEGNLCHPSTFYFYTTDQTHRDEFVDAVERFENTYATVRRHKDCYSVHVRRRDVSRPAGAVEWVKALGLWGLNSHKKHLPETVFELDRASIALLLARLWDGDGSMSAVGHASYDTASRRLAEDVQHLLLRLGIVSRLYERTRPYRGRTVTGFVVTITGMENLRRFHARIGRQLLSVHKRCLIERLLASPASIRSSRDIVPKEVRALIDRERRRSNLTWQAVGLRAGMSARTVGAPAAMKRGYRRWVIGNLAKSLDSRSLARLAESELYWDRVISVQPIGVQPTYDLQIEGDHNFLANDFVVHNSHAASFALIAYASAYLKAHHPAAFACALLNCWPMGFYHPATVVKDAQRHGVVVLPIDAAHSTWKCTIENRALRLGLRYVLGLRQEAAERLVAARPFASVDEAAQGGRLKQNELDALAHAGAFASLGLARREALWQAAAAERDPESLLAHVRPAAGAAPLPPMTAFEETAADYAATHVTAGPHVMAHLRDTLRADGVRSAADLADVPHGARVRIAGHVIVRQRPGTAKGMCFLTLEDETGTANAFVTPPLYERWRLVLNTSPLLEVEGPLERMDGVTHVRAVRFRRLDAPEGIPDGHNYW